MHHRAELALLEKPVERGAVAHVAGHKCGALGHGRARAVGKIVEDDDVRALFQQLVRHHASDISGPAGDENAFSHLYFHR